MFHTPLILAVANVFFETLFWTIVKSVFAIVGSLGLFLYGMKIMSNGIHRAAGDQLQKTLNNISTNRFLGVLTGFFVTAIIQSSSATTVMAVSFVDAGLLNLTQSMGIIMGANIGTTVTGWLTAILGFKVKISDYAIPIIGVGLPMFFSKKGKIADWGEFLVGFGLLFMGLSFMKKAMPDLGEDNIAFLTPLSNMGFLSRLIFVLAGAAVTIIVHSSSASMVMTQTMVVSGMLPFSAGAAMVLGSNIGTTIDAALASIGTNVNARRAARFHILFNVVGVVIAVIIFEPMLWLASLIVSDADPATQLALFHTIFNISNTFILIGFVPQLAAFIEKTVKPKAGEAPYAKYTLNYLDSVLQDMPETHLIQGHREVSHMAEVAEGMFEDFSTLLFSQTKKKSFSDKIKQLKEKEEYLDTMQEELMKYLWNFASNSTLSETQMNEVTSMLRIIQEVEHVGDNTYKLVLLLEKKSDKKMVFRDDARQQLRDFVQLVQKFLLFTKEHLEKKLEEDEFVAAYNLEEQIDSQLKKFRKTSRKVLQKGGDVKSEMLLIDFARLLEQIGDNCLNIAQTIRLTDEPSYV